MEKIKQGTQATVGMLSHAGTQFLPGMATLAAGALILPELSIPIGIAGAVATEVAAAETAVELVPMAAQTAVETAEAATMTDPLPQMSLRGFYNAAIDSTESVLMRNFSEDVVEFDPNNASRSARLARDVARGGWRQMSHGVWQNLGHMPK